MGGVRRHRGLVVALGLPLAAVFVPAALTHPGALLADPFCPNGTSWDNGTHSCH